MRKVAKKYVLAQPTPSLSLCMGSSLNSVQYLVPKIAWHFGNKNLKKVSKLGNYPNPESGTGIGSLRTLNFVPINP